MEKSYQKSIRRMPAPVVAFMTACLSRGFPNIAKGRTRGWTMLPALALVLIVLAGAASAQSPGVLREVYTTLSSSGNTLAALTNDSSFPDNPTPGMTGVLLDQFESPHNVLDHYGQRCRALLVPPVTGTYVFWIAANWSGAIYLSSDESPFNKTQITYQDTGTCPECWYTFAGQESTNILLQAGQRYYIEALQVAGAGDDALAVGWK